MFRYREKKIADMIIRRLKEMNLDIRLMHVCGTHQDTLIRYGLDSLLKGAGVEIRQGPGCPVCVTTSKEIEEALLLARRGKSIVVFGDMVKVPSESGSLAEARAAGADIEIVYSIEDCVKIALQKKKNKEVVFMGIGFETTTPSTAFTILNETPENFYVLSCHRLIPPALNALLKMGEVKLDGLIEPGHVSTIIGTKAYELISRKYKIPQVVAGFEPLDLLMGVYMLATQIEKGEANVENEYSRVVRKEGNPKALRMINAVFDRIDIQWRGFPAIQESGLELKKEYENVNARIVFEDILKEVEAKSFKEPMGCKCGEVLRGIIYSDECPLFKNICTPENPIGPCMVSVEGSCNIMYKYGR